MDFGLTDEQELFRQAIRDWTNKECPKAWANEAERDEDRYPFELWDKMTRAGLHGVGIDERYGGQGGDVVMQTILAREISRTLAGLSWVWGITSFVGAKSLGLYGSPEQMERFL